MKREHGGIRDSHPPGLVDFSSNLCPWGPPEVVRRLLRGDLVDLAMHYPDPGYHSLRKALGRYAGCPPGCVFPANGSEEIFFWICRFLMPRVALIIGPAYSEYALAAKAAGAEVRHLNARADEGFRPNMADAGALAADADIVFVCNPNNPTGRLLAREDIVEIETWLKPGAVMLVDEAFMDFVEEKVDRTAVPLVGERLWVSRSLTKFFSLAGLRLGYLVAPAFTVEALDGSTPLWRVNRIAEAAAMAALDDEEYIKEIPDRMAEERGRFARALEDTGMLEVFPGAANFMLAGITVDGMTAAGLQERLMGRGFLVRDASSFPGLDARFVRVAVLDRERNDALARAIGEVAAGG